MTSVDCLTAPCAASGKTPAQPGDGYRETKLSGYFIETTGRLLPGRRVPADRSRGQQQEHHGDDQQNASQEHGIALSTQGEAALLLERHLADHAARERHFAAQLIR